MECRLFRQVLSAVAPVLLTSFAASAHAASEGPNPHCLPGDKDHSNLVVLYKDAEKYDRVLTGFLTKESCRLNTVVLEAESQKLLSLSGNTSVAASLNLTDDQKKYLEQLRAGASYLHVENTGEDYLASHPDLSYTKDLNRDLTKKYGNGFSGDVYRAWIERQPQNKLARQRLMANMDLFAGSNPAADTAEIQGDLRASLANLYKDSVILVSMGLAWDDTITPQTPWYRKNFVTDMEGLGLPVQMLKRNPYGTIEENTETVRQQIQEALENKNYQRVYLMGLCKGTPEALQALTRILHDEPEYESKFGGYLNLSGQMGPVYFADNFSKITQNQGLAWFIKSNFPNSEYYGYDHSLPSLTTPMMNDVIQNHILPQLPKGVPYLNVVGILSGDGLPRTTVTPMVPFYKANRLFHLAKGANDGFLEYPDNMLPEGAVPLSYAVVFDGTHLLMDGNFGAYSFIGQSDQVNLKNRIAVYSAMFKTLIDLKTEQQ